MTSHEDFADTELASNNVSPLFPAISAAQAPRSQVYGRVHTAEGELIIGQAVHRGFPDADPKARRQSCHELEADHARCAGAFGDRKRHAAAVEAAYANGKTTGFREGYLAGAWWHRLVGAAWGIVGTGVVVGGLLALGVRID